MTKSGLSGDSAGFTLIELILVIIIIGAIAGIVSVTLRQGTDQFVEVTSRGDVMSRARYGLERMAREIRAAENNSVSTWTSTALEFDRPDPVDPAIVETVRFSWAGAPSNPVVMTVDAASNDLVDDVTSLAFTYYEDDGSTPANPNKIVTIVVELTVTALGESVTLSSTVYPRDF